MTGGRAVRFPHLLYRARTGRWRSLVLPRGFPDTVPPPGTPGRWVPCLIRAAGCHSPPTSGCLLRAPPAGGERRLTNPSPLKGGQTWRPRHTDHRHSAPTPSATHRPHPARRHSPARTPRHLPAFSVASRASVTGAAFPGAPHMPPHEAPPPPRLLFRRLDHALHHRPRCASRPQPPAPARSVPPPPCLPTTISSRPKLSPVTLVHR